jgi:putative peptidoglycan lipid II flippase
LLGYGALQLSFVIDRSLAVSLGDRAVPALTYVDRLIDLPIGIFAVSLGSVLMAGMAKAAAESDRESMKQQLEFSLRHVWFICAPLAAGVIFFHADVLRVLCLGGKYTMEDLQSARMVAIFYGLGIPFFCSLKVILPAFYARKQMKTPFYVSLIAITVNIIMNLILMIPLKQGGLALATVISSLVNNTLLLIILSRQGFGINVKTLLDPLRSLLLSLFAGAIIRYALDYAGYGVAGCGNIIKDIILLIVISALFGSAYLLGSWICRAGELREVSSLLLRRKKTRLICK